MTLCEVFATGDERKIIRCLQVDQYVGYIRMLVLTFHQVMLDDINEKHGQINALLELPPSQSADWDPGSFVSEKRNGK